MPEVAGARLLMKKTFLAGVAALSVLYAPAANSTVVLLKCAAPQIYKGDVGKSPIVGIAIWHSRRSSLYVR